MASTYIFCTSDVTETEISFLDEIDFILNRFKNDYVFSCKTSNDSEILDGNYEKFIDNNSTMDIVELFDVCKNIRRRYNFINEDEFVVLLTNKRNSKKWFSATDGRNIFINVLDLEKYSNNQSKYPIIFQIIENIFQAQCEIIYNNSIYHDKLHDKPKGCINDICKDKSNIIIKLKNSSICESCKEFAKSKGISKDNIDSLEEILQYIRNITITRLPKKTKQGYAIKVDNKCNIMCYDQIIEMQELLKAVFIFFLIHDAGFKHDELKNHVKEIALLYDKARGRYDQFAELSNEKIDRINNIVSKTKSNGLKPLIFRKLKDINDNLEKQINPELVDELKILKGPDGAYRVKIHSSRIHISNELKGL